MNLKTKQIIIFCSTFIMTLILIFTFIIALKEIDIISNSNANNGSDAFINTNKLLYYIFIPIYSFHLILIFYECMLYFKRKLRGK